MRWFAPAAILLIGWGALAFGAEYPWAYAPLLAFAATIGVLGLAGHAPGAGRFRGVALSLGLVAVAGGLQVVPLPSPVVSTVSPARSDRDYGALYAAALPASPPAVERPARTLSIEPSRTVIGLALLAAMSVFFLGAARALPAAHPSRVVRGLIVLGVIVALAGIVQEASGGRMVYGVWGPRKAWLPSAPFVNPNHGAGWLLMTFSVALGHLGGLLTQAVRYAPRGWRRRAVWLDSREASEIMLVGFAVLVMALSIFVAGSVSGMGCLAAAAAAFAWQAARRPAGWWSAAVPVAVASVVVGAAAWAGPGAVGDELATTLGSAFEPGGRVGLWRDTARIVGDFPLAGTGLNTYGIAMLAYQTHGLEMRAVEAHNDYLQLAAEGGLLLGAPILLAAGAFVREVRRRFREGRDDSQTRWVRMGAVTGLGAVALQELVDFSLQMPGNAVLFALLMALAAHRPADQSLRTHSGTSHPPRSQS